MTSYRNCRVFRVFLLSLTATVFSGCGLLKWDLALFANSVSAFHSISGKVLPLDGVLGKEGVLCAGAKASLYALSEEGKRIEPALQTVDVGSDASYKFQNLDQLGVQAVSETELKRPYLVEVVGCGSVYARLVSASNHQDVSYGSTLISYVLQVPSINAYSADLRKLQGLIEKLNVHDGYVQAYGALLSQTALKQEFTELFGSSPTVLETAPPWVTEVEVPSSMKEGEAAKWKVQLVHWKSDYETAVTWKMDGVTLSHDPEFTYIAGKNAQGLHEVQLVWGRKTGGEVDQTEPYKARVFPVSISNDYPPEAPSISVANNVVFVPSVDVEIETGAGLVNCESFSKMALVVGATEAPSDDKFTLSCTDAPAKWVEVALPSDPGEYILALWVKDGAGNVSVSPKTAAVTYEKLPAPALAFSSSSIANQITKTNSVTFTGSCEAGLPIVIEGEDLATVSCSDGSFSYTTVSQNTDGVRAYTFTQTNVSGVSTLITGTWERDTVAPIVQILSPEENTPARDGVLLTGTCEEGLPLTISGSGVLGAITTSCSTGTFSQMVYFSAGEGSKTITVSQVDVAGNTGSASRSFIRDTTGPLLTQTLQSLPYHSKNNTAQFGGSCEYNASAPSVNKITVTGADTAETYCQPNGTWTYTTASQTTDASRTYEFSQTDLAGNTTSAAVVWVRDTVPPNITITSTKDFVTSSNSVTFSGSCETGLPVEVSGTQTTTVPCSGGTWHFTATQLVDATYTYNFSQTDRAGNSKSVSGSWTRVTTGPTIEISQSTPQINRESSLIVSGTCSGGAAEVESGEITVTINGENAGTATCSSTNSDPGTWSYTVTRNVDGEYNLVFTITDKVNMNSSAEMKWIRDTTPPALVNGSFKVNGGDGTVTDVGYNTVEFQATDSLSNVESFCVKLTAAAPADDDSCWYPVSGPLVGATPSSSVHVTNYPLNLGILPLTYDVYLWVKDTAGNISTNFLVRGKDWVQITLASIEPPNVNTVLVSKTDEMEGNYLERVIPGGSDVYIRWTLMGSELGATPVKLSFSTDDVNWVEFASGLANGVNNCSSLKGPGSASANATGCYRWVGGSPTSESYRIRVTATNQKGAVAFFNSQPINAPQVGLLAGNLESGVGGSVNAAVFLRDESMGMSAVRSGSFVVTESGVVYVLDHEAGLVTVDPSTGFLKVVLRRQQECSPSPELTPVTNSCLWRPIKMVLDHDGNLIILDQLWLRKVHLGSSTPQVETIAGGGSSMDFDLTDPLQLAFNNPDLNRSTDGPILKVLPNNDILFMVDSFKNDHRLSANRFFRIYSQTTKQIRSQRITGVGYPGAPTSDVTGCRIFDIAFTFNPGDLVASELLMLLNLTTNDPLCPGTTGNSNKMILTRLNPLTYTVDTSTKDHPATADTANTTRAFVSLSGVMYTYNRTRVYRYVPNEAGGTNKKVLGTNYRGFCPVGTKATECDADIDDIYVTASGTLYFLTRGAIRMVDANGNVQNVFGQAFGQDDGLLATNARFNKIGTIDVSPSGRIAIFDSFVYRIREFIERGGIQTIIGNGMGGNAETGPGYPSVTQPLPLSSTTHDVAYMVYLNDDRIAFNTTLKIISIWDRANGYATPVVGGGDVDYRFAEGLAGIDTFYDRIIPLGYGNGHLIAVGNGKSSGYTVDYNLLLYDSSNSFALQTLMKGKNLDSTPTSTLCNDGVDLHECTPPISHSTQYRYAIIKFWQPLSSWLVRHSSQPRRIASLVPGGVMQTLVTLEEDATSFTPAHHNGRDYIFYCSSESGRLRRVDVTNPYAPVEEELSWPVQSWKCTGKNLVYDVSTGTPRLIFQVELLGLHGVAYHQEIFE